MKMTLNLTFEDGMKVVNALRECAINNGHDEDELDELDSCGVMSEYTAVVDAALTAMGIEVSLDVSEEEDGDEDEDFDEDNEEVDDFGLPTDYWSEFDEDNDENENTEYDDSCQYSLTAKGEFVVRYMEAGHTFEEACEVADCLFGEGKGE